MDNMKIRYVYERDGKRTLITFSIDEVEYGIPITFIDSDGQIIGRDLGTEICGKTYFENDIVSACIYADNEPQILKVIFRDGCFLIEYNDGDGEICALSDFIGSTDIIGNTWQNPELLEVKG